MPFQMWCIFETQCTTIYITSNRPQFIQGARRRPVINGSGKAKQNPSALTVAVPCSSISVLSLEAWADVAASYVCAI